MDEITCISSSGCTHNDECGGGGGESGQSTAPTESTQNQGQINLANGIRLADVASELNVSTFSLASWSPTAIQRSGDVLYIANNQPTVEILRYDLKNKTVLSSISAASTIGNTGKLWADISDIYIAGNRLYVSSSGSHRADIFDISGTAPAYFGSLGTGSTNGGQPFYAMTNPSAVIANDQYVFVADNLNRIKVWTQETVNGKSSASLRKFSRFALPSCGSGCVPRLEIIGDQLYATTTNGHTYVYNFKNIHETLDTESLVQPDKTQNSVATVVHSATDNLLYAAQPSGKIVSYSKNNLASLTTALPSSVVDNVQQYRLAGQNGQNLPKSLDLTVYGDVIYTLSSQKIIALPLRKIKQVISDTPVASTNLLESKATEQTRMLQDGESWATLINTTLRNIPVNKILSASFTGSGIHLQSYNAAEVNNLKIVGKLRQSEQRVEIATLDRLTPFSTSKLNLTIDKNAGFNLVNKIGSARIEGLSNFSEVPVELFEEVKITSDSDTHVQKLNTIKAQWKLTFGTYNPESDSKWCRITPLYAREWVIMMTNFAYRISTPEFETLWFNHKAAMGHDFFGNAGRVEGTNGYFKAEDYKNIYNSILNRGQISLGVTNMGGGLGGGQVLGVGGWIYYGHYRQSGYRIVAHEFGHHWGGHNSAWAMEGWGFEAMMDNLNFYFQRQPGSLPYMDPNLNSFHTRPDSELCQGISQNILNGVASKTPWNKVDEYFKNNPLPK